MVIAEINEDKFDKTISANNVTLMQSLTFIEHFQNFDDICLFNITLIVV